MVRIPTVSAQAPPGARYDAAAIVPYRDFAGAQGQDLAAAGQALAARAQEQERRERDRADNAAVLGGDNRLAFKLRQTLTEFELLKGREATESRKAIEKRLRQIVDEEARAMAPGDQADLFRLKADARLTDALSDVDKHAQVQARVYEHAEEITSADNHAQDALRAAARGDYAKAHALRQAATTSAQRAAEIAGFGPEQTKKLVGKIDSKIHGGFVRELLSQHQPDKARQYLAAWQGQMDPEDHRSLTEAVAIKSRDQHAQNLATEVAKPGVSLLEQVDALKRRNEADPAGVPIEVVDGAISRLVRDEGIRQQSEAEQVNATRARVEQELGNALYLDEVSAADRQTLQKAGVWPDVVNWFNSGRAYETDREAWQQLQDMRASPWLASMSDAEFERRFRTKLDNQHYEMGLAYLEASRGTANAKQTAIVQVADVIEFVASRNGLGKLDIGTVERYGSVARVREMQQRRFLFEEEVQKRVNEFEIQKYGGKAYATRDEVKDLAQQVAADQAFYGGRKVPVSSIPPDEQGVQQGEVEVNDKTIRIGAIPPDVRSEIVAKWRAARGGERPLEEDVIRWWDDIGQPRTITEMRTANIPNPFVARARTERIQALVARISRTFGRGPGPFTPHGPNLAILVRSMLPDGEQLSADEFRELEQELRK